MRGPSIDVTEPLLKDAARIGSLLNADPDDENSEEHERTTKLLTDKEWSAASNVWPTLKKVRVASLSVFFNFLVTIALFPATTVKIASIGECDSDASRFSNDLFIPFMFVLFNSGDLVGRIVSGFSRLGVSTDNLFPLACGRVIFFPLFLLCNVTDSQLPHIFLSDVWPCSFMFLFGVSGGFVANVSMMLGPALVSPRNAALAGNIMILSLSTGLLGGSMASFLVLYISQGSF